MMFSVWPVEYGVVAQALSLRELLRDGMEHLGFDHFCHDALPSMKE
jgi:hypothetical protein